MRRPRRRGAGLLRHRQRGLIDLDAARAAVTARTRALLVVDLYGQMVEPAAAEALAGEHGIALVCDAAQSLGASAGGRPAGSTGEVACLSFDPTKTLAAPGSGGAVVCDSDELAVRVRRLRWHGRDASGLHVELGFNSQLPSAAAAVLRDKLALAPEWTRRRRAIAAAYDAALAGGPHRPLGVAPGREHSFHKYVVRSPRRDALRAALDDAGVPALVHYPRPLYRQPLFGPDPRGARACPRAEDLCASVLSLPIHAYLTGAEVEDVCRALAGARARGAGVG